MARSSLFLFGASKLPLVVVLGRVVNFAFYVDYDLCSSSIAWTL
jgi:hypothetical protein